MVVYCNYALQAQDYNKNILAIINNHFDIAEGRIDEVYDQHFSAPKAVFTDTGDIQKIFLMTW
jgi:hypothetical protein